MLAMRANNVGLTRDNVVRKSSIPVMHWQLSPEVASQRARAQW